MKTIDEKRTSSVQEITHCLPNNDLLFVNSADEQATLWMVLTQHSFYLIYWQKNRSLNYPGDKRKKRGYIRVPHHDKTD